MKKIAFVLLLFLCACASNDFQNLPPWERGQAVKIDDLRPVDARATIVRISLNRKSYNRALIEGGNLNTARLIETFSSRQSISTPPQYRVFDVQRGGIYDMLHLKTADIIISAGGYVIPNQSIFWQYLNMMGKMDGGSIEVIRAGRTFNLIYDFKNKVVQQVPSEPAKVEYKVRNVKDITEPVEAVDENQGSDTVEE